MNATPSTNCSFTEDVVNELPAIAPQGIGTYETREYSVSVADGLHELADALIAGLRVRIFNEPLESTDVEDMLMNLVELRCLQVTRRLPRDCRAQDILVPDFFMPFLAHIRRVDLPLISVEFTPSYTEDEEKCEDTEEEQERCEEVARLRGIVDSLSQTARVLKQCGVRFSQGLPRELSTDDAGLLHIQETEEGEFLVAGGAPAETDLLIRSVIRMGFQPEFFGEARTRYARVEDYRNSLWRIVETAYRPLG